MKKKTYSVTQSTKQAICDSLKQLMQKKELNKITIAEIMEHCGMARQQFYYHFEDIYDLVRWMFQEEALSLLQQQEGTALWQDGLLQLFRYLQENRAVCLCALRSMGREHLKRFFHAEIYALIHRTIEEISEENGFHGKSIDVELLTHFYVVSFAGLAESWLLGEIDKTPEELIRFTDTFLRDQICVAIMRLNGTGSESSADENNFAAHADTDKNHM